MFRCDADALIHSLADLVRALGVGDLCGANLLLASEAAVAPAGLDCDRDGIRVCVGPRAVALTFPFSLLDFWIAVRDVDELAAADREECGR